ncbi:MAG: hypothetical protein V1493_06405 [Candidatus Diapherotrites archaeon]
MAEEFLPAGLDQFWKAAEPFLNIIYPNFSAVLPNVLVMAVSISVYAVMVYVFYRFLAKKNIFQLGLSKYKRADHGFVNKIFNTILGTIQYSIVFPLVVFLWFAGFSLMLLLLAKNIGIEQILLVSVAFVSSIRITAYFTENLSQDLAKLIPFALLGVAIVDPAFFSLELFAERARVIPGFLVQIATYCIFLILLEWTLRILLFIKTVVFGGGKEKAQIKA